MSSKATAGMIEQVMMNLSVNARDAMPRGGRLTIGIETVTIDAALHRNPSPGAHAGVLSGCASPTRHRHGRRHAEPHF